MSTETLALKGELVDGRIDGAFAGFGVEAWSLADDAPAPLAAARCDAYGTFKLKVPIDRDGHADDSIARLELRVLDGAQVVVAQVVDFALQRGGEHSLRIPIPERNNDHATVAQEAELPMEVDTGKLAEYTLLESYLVSAQREDVADLAALSEDALTAFADDIDVEPQKLLHLQRARSLEAETGVSAAVFYALSREGCAADLHDLIDVSMEELRATIAAAVRDGVVEKSVMQVLEDRLPQLCARIIDLALSPHSPSPFAGLGEIMACSDLPPATLRRVLHRYQSRPSAVAGFWDNLADESEGEGEAIGEDVRSELATAVSLGGLLGPDPTLIRRVFALRREGRWRQLEDLCELEFDDWCEVLESIETYPPDATVGVNVDEDAPDVVALRAEAIRDTFEETFPSSFIRRELVRADMLDDSARQLMARVGGHDFLHESIRQRAEGDPALLEGMDPQEATEAIEAIEAVERVSRVTHRASEVRVLLDGGFDSAHSIAAQPRRQFIDAHAEDLGGRAQASHVHAQAQQVAASGTLAMVRLLQALQQSPFVLNGGAQPAARARLLKDMPDTEALFGSNGMCGCDHCRSVYSPAAYLVDLLRRIDVRNPEQARQKKGKKREATLQSPVPAATPPLDVLLARRPDIADTALTCENTTTPLPYIDLVNEVLEARITGRSAAHDTGKTPADVLKAVPQYVDRDAYAQLRRAVHPFTLPFHEPLAVTRAYLGHLGLRRRELLATFRRGDVGELALLAESLEMSPEEFDALALPPRQPWLHYGFDAEQKDGVSWIEQLTPARTLMQSTGIGFQELIDLVGTRFVNQDEQVKLESPSADCDPAQIRITGLDETRLTRMMRLLRLRRRLGLTMADLDRTLFALDVRELDSTALHKLVDGRDLSRRLDRPIVELLALWSPLDTWGDDSQFERLLKTRAVAWRLQDADAFRLREDRRELAHTADTQDAVAPALLAAFRLTGEELALAQAMHARVAGGAARLDLAGLSGVYRVAFLARALKLRIDELDGVLRLVPDDAQPFRAGDPAATRRFVDIVKEIQRSSFSPEQLGYLYDPSATPRRDPGPPATEVQSVLNGIRQALADAIAETTLPADPTQDVLRQKLGMWFDAALVDRAMEVLDPRSQLATGKRRAFLEQHLRALFPDPEAAAGFLFAVPAPTPAAPSRVEAVSSADISVQLEAPETGPQRGSATEHQWRANIGRVLVQLLPLLRTRQMRGAVVKALSDALGTSSISTGRLLDGVMQSRRSLGRPLLDDFYALAGTGLTGRYYAGGDMHGEPATTRTDAKLEFVWAGEPPVLGLQGKGFGVRWAGRLLPRSKARHVFFVRADGAVRLAVSASGTTHVLLDEMGGTGTIAEYVSKEVALDPAELHEIAIEYRSKGAMPSFSLQYGTSPDSRQSIPEWSLYPLEGLTSFEPVALGYRRLHKAATLVKGFGIGDELLEWLTSGSRLLDLDRLPMAPGEGDTPVASFSRWRQLAALHGLQKALVGSPADLVASFRAPTLPQSLALLAKATGWDESVVVTLAGGRGFSIDLAALGLPSDPSQEPFFVRLARAVDIHRRAGVSAETLFAWAAGAPEADLAAAIMQAVKARYDEKRWLEVAEGLNDPLRMERREALIAYLLPRLREQGVANRSQLFEYFLIDVEMNPCMLTSRVKQAISAVQTFYQRCLMNLEWQVNPRIVDDADWQWLKNYRVWEANRKVFLYPENWIEPELRDDKSPEFKVLERTILQQEITKENVESAFIDYLQGIDEISRLNVRAVWFEPREAQAGRVWLRPRSRSLPPGQQWEEGSYHIFARTYNAPHKWFYRRLEKGRAWTPWLKIDADIEGDHLVPVIFQNRMHLFWTVFHEKNKPAPDPEKDAPPIKLGKDWEIGLAYSVFDRGRWTRKQLSSGNVVDNLNLVFMGEYTARMHTNRKRLSQPRIEGSAWLPVSAYTLRAEPANDRDTLTIRLYRSVIDRQRTILLSDPQPQAVLSRTDLDLIAHFELIGCNGELAPATIDSNRRVAGSRLQVPPGYAVDGNAFRAAQANVPMLLMPTTSGGIAPVLSAPAGSTRGIRVVPVGDSSGQSKVELSPFFFEDPLRSYFVRPVPMWIGPREWNSKPRATPLAPAALGRIPHFGPRRGSRFFKGGRGASGRKRESIEAYAEDVTELADELRLETPERAADREVHFEAIDDWDNEEDDAWHPDDAEARRAIPKRKSPQKAHKPTRQPSQAPAWAARSSPTRRAVRLALGRVQVPAHWEQRLRFTPFEHPQTCRLINILKSDGIDELLELRTSRPGDVVSAVQDHIMVDGRWVPAKQTVFERRYRPGVLADRRFPTLDIDFDQDNPYALYNWELFFHAPLQVAIRLAKDGRHEEAQRWFHFIFDPTSDKRSPPPRRYWRFAPFHENTDYDGARELLALFSYDGLNPELQARRVRAQEQVFAWLEKPFSPHTIARLRLAAYQKAVVMKYIDNLIEWGDKLFRRDTLETIQEATQLYILASSILGPRAERVPALTDPAPLTFRQVRDKLDVFANWAVRLEHRQVRRPFRIGGNPDTSGATSILGLATLYFCVPANPELDKKWDTVADRLYKIRNCMNISGVVRRLALFEPPIDPSMLVRAAAAGVDLGSVIASLNAPPPIHRFRFLVRRAVDLADRLRSWSVATLSAIEKRDAEQLAALRQANERSLLEAVRDAHKTLIKQVEEELSALHVQRDYVDVQLQYVAAQVQQIMIPQEQAKQQSLTEAQVIAGVAEGIDLVAKVMHAIPEVQAGAAGGFSSPFATVQLGGQMFGNIASAVAESMFKVMNKFQTEADMAGAQAEAQRRKLELMHEGDLLVKDRDRLQKQIAQVQLKLELTNAELKRHETGVENAKRIADWLRSKYTNEELYGWMLGQLSSTFFQAYKLAFDTAKLAERALQFERADSSVSYIEFSYWDSFRKGLLCGERLLVDLGRMEAAALEQDRRALEVVRHISLKDDAPAVFEQLLSTGRCSLDVDETLLDGDFPGQYFRRLKTVTMSVNGALTPTSNIHCSLTLIENRIRVSANSSGSYPKAQEGDDARFLLNIAPVQAVATSLPTADAGVFNLRFDDDRYLPFEGAGAISSWRIELHQADNPIELCRLSNVVVSLSYTARSGGAPLEAAARAHRESALARGGLVLPMQKRVSIRHDVPQAWQQLRSAGAGQDVDISIPLGNDSLPARLLDFDVRIESVTLYARARRKIAMDGLQVRISPPRGESVSANGWSRPWPMSATLRLSAEVKGPPGMWKLSVAAREAKVTELLEDLVVLVDLRAQRGGG